MFAAESGRRNWLRLVNGESEVLKQDTCRAYPISVAGYQQYNKQFSIGLCL